MNFLSSANTLGSQKSWTMSTSGYASMLFCLKISLSVLTYGIIKIQLLPISKYMIDDTFNSPEKKNMKFHHLFCSFVPCGQYISQCPHDSEESEVGSFLESAANFRSIFISLRRGFVTKNVQFNAFEGSCWHTRPLQWWKWTFRWFEILKSQDEGWLENSHRLNWTPTLWLAATPLHHKLRHSKAILKEFLKGFKSVKRRLLFSLF